MPRAQRSLLVVTPLVAMAAVALGLRIGAPGGVRAAVVYGAPAPSAGSGLAWQLATFDEDHGAREPVALPEVDVTGRSAGRETHWKGATNEDGTAEMFLAMPMTPEMSLEVHAGHALLARGVVHIPTGIARPPPSSAWAGFARREGAVGLDVAVLGQRVASGFPASIWVRATDAGTGAPLAGVEIEPERDASLSTSAATTLTDTRGWAHVVATPMGYGVALILHARARNGTTGLWAGALFVSPGAAQIVSRDRYAPDEEPTLDVVVPNVRSTLYVEVDDAYGRTWAAAVPLIADGGAMPGAHVRVPKLAPGMYWVVVASDPAGSARLGPGTMVRPFLVAASDEAGLAFGTDKDDCAPPRDSREAARVLSVCLAVAGATPVPHWTALEGFSLHHARDAQRRAAGLAVAVGAVGLAMLLETMLLLRAAHAARARLHLATSDEEKKALDVEDGRAASVAIAVLVALLGFALLAAFLVRAG